MNDIRANAASQHRATDERSLVSQSPPSSHFAGVRFEAFRISGGRTYQLGLISATTTGEALNAALAGFPLFHKDQLLIRETDDRSSRLHLYRIKRRSAPTYVYRDYQTHREHRLYADHVCSIDETAINREAGSTLGEK